MRPKDAKFLARHKGFDPAPHHQLFWYLQTPPTGGILAATHNVEFAKRWERRVRNDIAAYAHVLGLSLSENSKAAARWALTSGGEYCGGWSRSRFRANLGFPTKGDMAVRALFIWGRMALEGLGLWSFKKRTIELPHRQTNDQVDGRPYRQLLDQMVPGSEAKREYNE